MMPPNYYKKCAKIFPNFHVAHRWVPAGLESWLTPAAPLSGARIRALKAAAAAAAHIVLWLLQIANYNNHGNLKTPQHECFVNAEVWNEDIKHWTPFQIPSWITFYTDHLFIILQDIIKKLLRHSGDFTSINKSHCEKKRFISLFINLT